MTPNEHIEGDLDGLLAKFLIHQRQNIVVPYLASSENILDLGCGIFRWKNKIRENTSYTGIDVEPEIISFNRSNFPHYAFYHQNLDQETLPFPPDSFDLVIMLAVIEHLKNPVHVLTEVRRMLSNDGVIIASTPHPRGELIMEMGSKVKIFSQDKHSHQPLLDYKKIEEITKESGLKITEFKPFLFSFNQKIVMQKN